MPSVRIPAPSASGNRLTDTAENASEAMETRRRPNRSTRAPTKGETKIPGIAAAAATSPASAAEPVSCSTSHGMSTATVELATPPRRLAT